MDANELYYGDNLDILPRYVGDESVDLIYLDPPFKSNQDYNVLFAERDGTQAAAQIKAFEDTWRWDQAAVRGYEEVVERGGPVADALRAFRICVGQNDMLAYLSMMAPRLVELQRALKPTGSLYLHCDPTSSHYLKLLLDAVFGPENFRGEIVWKRSSAHSDTKQGSKQPGRIHDVLLFYTKTSDWAWNEVYTPDAHDAPGVGIRQRAHQHPVDDAEHRSGDAGAQREDEYHRGLEAGRPPEAADGVAQVPPQIVEPAPAPDVARPLADRGGVTQLPPGRAQGLALREAGVALALPLELQVESDLLLAGPLPLGAGPGMETAGRASPAASLRRLLARHRLHDASDGLDHPLPLRRFPQELSEPWSTCARWWWRSSLSECPAWKLSS